MDLTYRPHKYQEFIHNDSHRFKVVVAGRRFGKSTLARWNIILNALVTPGRYWIVSPTIKQGKDNHWNDPQNNLLLDTAQFRSYENASDLAIEIPSKAGEKSRIEIKGIENLEKTRGAGLKGAVLDEAAYLSEYSWSSVIKPMLFESQGWGMFIGTPFGFNWFEKIFRQGKIYNKIVEKKFTDNHGTYPIWQTEMIKKPPEPKKIYEDWASFHYTSYDSPLATFWDLEKERLAAIDKKKEDWFFQEYVADFRKVHGLIYTGFDRNIHVIEPFEIPDLSEWELYRAIDFGFDNPTVCLWVAVSPEGRWYLIDEYFETKQSSDYHCGMILSKTSQYFVPTATYGDPSAPQIISDWAQKGVYITAARRDSNTNKSEWVGHGIDLIKEKLKVSPIDGKPDLFVFRNCENTIREFETYRWKEEKDETLNNPGRPEKANDHCLDSLRYMAVTFKGKQEIYLPKDDKDWSFV